MLIAEVVRHLRIDPYLPPTLPCRTGPARDYARDTSTSATTLPNDCANTAHVDGSTTIDVLLSPFASAS